MSITTSRWGRGFFGVFLMLFLASALIGCGRSSKKEEPPAEAQAEEQKGSLSQTFTLIDEQGRKSGTLTLQPFGGAILRDLDGTVLKEYAPGGTPSTIPQSAATPAEPQPTEAPAESTPAESETENKTDQ